MFAIPLLEQNKQLLTEQLTSTTARPSIFGTPSCVAPGGRLHVQKGVQRLRIGGRMAQQMQSTRQGMYLSAFAGTRPEYLLWVNKPYLANIPLVEGIWITWLSCTPQCMQVADSHPVLLAKKQYQRQISDQVDGRSKRLKRLDHANPQKTNQIR